MLVILSLALIVSIIQTGRTRKELKAAQFGAHPALGGRVMGEGGAPRLEAPEEEEEEEGPPEG